MFFLRPVEGKPWLVVGSPSIGLSTDQKVDLVEHMKTCAQSNAPFTTKRLQDLVRRFYYFNHGIVKASESDDPGWNKYTIPDGNLRCGMSLRSIICMRLSSKAQFKQKIGGFRCSFRLCLIVLTKCRWIYIIRMPGAKLWGQAPNLICQDPSSRFLSPGTFCRCHIIIPFQIDSS